VRERHGEDNRQGEIGEAMILADLQRQGHGVAIPWGHDLPFDLIVVRKEDGTLEKVQCKYTTSDGRGARAGYEQFGLGASSLHERGGGLDRVYDATTDQCFYLPASDWDGQLAMAIRLTPTANGQLKGIRFAADFRVLEGDLRK
jgi:PD-(D/E)XK endonuclease